MEDNVVSDHVVVSMQDHKDKLQTIKGINLDVGCGPHKQPGPGWIGIDCRPLAGVDIVHDLFMFPWPLEDNSVNLLIMSHYLEHVPPTVFMQTMAEVHRLCRHKSQVLIAGPYGLGYRYLQDPTHCRPIVEQTFSYFDPTLAREVATDHPSKGNYWSIYRPPVFHMISFSRIPAGGDADFNCALEVCKDPDNCDYCSKGRRW